MSTVETTGADTQLSLLEIVQEVALQCGLGDQITQVNGGTASSHDQLARLIVSLVNEREQVLFDKAGKLKKLVNWEAAMACDLAYYTPTAGYLSIAGEPRVSEHPLVLATYDRVLESDPALHDLGMPEEYYQRNGLVYINPAPSPEFMRNKCVYVSGTWYFCTRDHFADSDHATPPGNTDDWSTDEDAHAAMNAWIAGDSDWDTDDFAWESEKNYLRGYLDTPIIAGRTYLKNDTDIPTLPVEFYPALIAGAAYRLAFTKGLGTADTRREARNTYLELLADRINNRRKDTTNPREYIADEERI